MYQALGHHWLAEVGLKPVKLQTKNLAQRCCLLKWCLSRQDEKDGELLRLPPVRPIDPIILERGRWVAAQLKLYSTG